MHSLLATFMKPSMSTWLVPYRKLVEVQLIILVELLLKPRRMATSVVIGSFATTQNTTLSNKASDSSAMCALPFPSCQHTNKHTTTTPKTSSLVFLFRLSLQITRKMSSRVTLRAPGGRNLRYKREDDILPPSMEQFFP
jgi:hypothetical protein